MLRNQIIEDHRFSQRDILLVYEYDTASLHTLTYVFTSGRCFAFYLQEHRYLFLTTPYIELVHKFKIAARL